MKTTPWFAATLLLIFCSAGTAAAQTEGRPCEAEPTDELLTYGDFVTCEIGPLGDSDLFRFQGVVGEVVMIRATDQDGGSSSPSCVLELLRPLDLNVVAAVGANTTCEIRVTLGSTGLFTIRVTEGGNNNLMTYVLELDRMVPTPPTASSINPGDTLLSRIDPRGDADLFIFDGAAGDIISLRVTDSTGGGSTPAPVLQLSRPDGTIAATDVDNTTAQLDLALDQTGVFIARVTEAGDHAVMNYSIEYQCLAGSCPSLHTLTVSRTGLGSVTSNPAGITCGDDCSERFFTNTEVLLTPVPNPSWEFTGWTGAADCADGIVTVNDDVGCTANFIPVFDLYDGDGWADLAVWRPGSGIWYVLRSGDGLARTRQWGSGAHNDVPVPGDYDNDGKPDPAVWRPASGVWYVIRSTDGMAFSQQWGANGDVPVPGDYDNDGKTDFAVWRPSTGVWYVRRSSNGTTFAQQWGSGAQNDKPVPGDYDNDGKTDLAVWRPVTGVWYVVRSSNGTTFAQQWGAGFPPFNDIPVPGDYDGDGQTDIAVWRSSNGVWYVLRSTSGTPFQVQWGAGFPPYDDVPVPRDYDGDGKTDIAVWRASTGVWYVIRSLNGSSFGHQWGAGYQPYNDVPVPR